MPTPTQLLFVMLAVSIGLALLLAARPHVTASRGGKILAFVALFMFPVLSATWGGVEHMERSKQTSFCLSCHVMQDHGRSLQVEDPTFLAASHYQNNRIPRDQACYTCHTDYVLYGGLRAKLRGLRHVYAQYVGTPAQPLKLYSPYRNRECLHCHQGARSFEEGAIHNSEPELLATIKADQLSCMSSGCHETVHNLEAVKSAPVWKPTQ